MWEQMMATRRSDCYTSAISTKTGEADYQNDVGQKDVKAGKSFVLLSDNSWKSALFILE